MADPAPDIHTAGYDVHSGAGLYNALDAVYAVFTPTAPDLTAPTDTGSSNTDNLIRRPIATSSLLLCVRSSVGPKRMLRPSGFSPPKMCLARIGLPRIAWH